MRAQDIELKFRQSGHEKATREVLQALAEEINDLRRGLVVLAQIQDKQADMVALMVQTADRLKSAHEEINKQLRPEDGQDANTYKLGNGGNA